MDVLKLIRDRRSIRHFKDTPIPRDVIESLIDLGRWAPSHCNFQSCRFILVEDKFIRRSMVDHGGSAVIASAPLGILICNDHRSVNTNYRDWIQSAAAAAQNILLGAHAFGLGGCWVCHLPRPQTLKRIFNIPPFYSPVTYVALGYPLWQPKPVLRRRKIAEIYNVDRFPDLSEAHNNSFIFSLKKLTLWCYYLLPRTLKKKIAEFVDGKFIKKYEN